MPHPLLVLLVLLAATNMVFCLESLSQLCKMQDGSLNYPNIPGAPSASAYQAVPSSSWTYSIETESPTAYPLGFRKAILYEDNNPAFGFTINNVMGKKIEVMIETMQAGAQICLRDLSSAINMATGRIVQRCGAGRIYACFNGPTDVSSLDLVVYCDASCRSSHTDFWYRVVTSNTDWRQPYDPDTGMNIEMWCDMQGAINSTMFPKQLSQALPANFEVVDTSIQAPSAAVSLFSMASVVFVVSSFLLSTLMLM